MNQEEIVDALWNISNTIEELTCKLNSVGDLLEIVAERVPTDPDSGAVWLARDVTKDIADKFDECTYATMEIMREVKQLQINVPKKGKK
jgi:hypothetical protein